MHGSHPSGSGRETENARHAEQKRRVVGVVIDENNPIAEAVERNNATYIPIRVKSLRVCRPPVGASVFSQKGPAIEKAVAQRYRVFCGPKMSRGAIGAPSPATLGSAGA